METHYTLCRKRLRAEKCRGKESKAEGNAVQPLQTRSMKRESFVRPRSKGELNERFSTRGKSSTGSFSQGGRGLQLSPLSLLFVFFRTLEPPHRTLEDHLLSGSFARGRFGCSESGRASFPPPLRVFRIIMKNKKKKKKSRASSEFDEAEALRVWSPSPFFVKLLSNNTFFPCEYPFN